jgi:hypothetical protein
MGVRPGRYPTLETEFLTSLQQLCSQGFVINNNTVTVLDLKTPVTFDNQYYENLPSGEGLLESDQLLYSNGGSTREVGGILYPKPRCILYELQNVHDQNGKHSTPYWDKW